MTLESWLALGGFVLNLLVMLGGMVTMSVKLEHRLTRLESHLESLMQSRARRRTDAGPTSISRA